MPHQGKKGHSEEILWKKKLEVPLIEKLKSIPEAFGIRVNEQPHYETLMHEGSKEIWRYTHVVVAKTVIYGKDYAAAMREGFLRLASYIFGQERDGDAISMTSPVLEELTGDGEWTMSFILPAEISLSMAPTPKDPRIVLGYLYNCHHFFKVCESLWNF